MRVSIVIPTMNEEKTIGQVIDSLKYLKPDEIFVVDTNSTDKTREIAESKGAIIIDEPRRGYGRAYKTGIEKCNGDIIVCLDGDGTYPSEVIRPLIEILDADQVDFISCDRMTLRSQNSYTNLHLIGNKILNYTISVLYGYRLFDSQSGMWIFRHKIYKNMPELSDGMSFSQEIKIEAFRKGTLIEIPIRYGIRLSKPKLNTWGDGFSNLFGLFIKYVRR
ncbi:MAG: glycosyltransferase family 2 protein [Candidatus Thermoplasmatota archaeon]|jgi:glycosyltransferase involved in cell wall biosynthesis|nr:glycosyltransferase family 2 protein [Candidatus Thermoplasmatota archaeon]